MTLWEVVTGFDPAQQMPLADLALAIRDRSYHPLIPPIVPTWLDKILRGCWEPKPEARMSLDEISKIAGESTNTNSTNKKDMTNKKKGKAETGDSKSQLEQAKARLAKLKADLRELLAENEQIRQQLDGSGFAPPSVTELDGADKPNDRKSKRRSIFGGGSSKVQTPEDEAEAEHKKKRRSIFGGRSKDEIEMDDKTSPKKTNKTKKKKNPDDIWASADSPLEGNYTSIAAPQSGLPTSPSESGYTTIEPDTPSPRSTAKKTTNKTSKKKKKKQPSKENLLASPDSPKENTQGGYTPFAPPAASSSSSHENVQGGYTSISPPASPSSSSVPASPQDNVQGGYTAFAPPSSPRSDQGRGGWRKSRAPTDLKNQVDQ